MLIFAQKYLCLGLPRGASKCLGLPRICFFSEFRVYLRFRRFRVIDCNFDQKFLGKFEYL